MVVMYLSGRFLLAIRMPFGVELNSTSFFYSILNDDKHGRKKIKEMCLFFFDVSASRRCTAAGGQRPAKVLKIKKKKYIYLSEFNF